MLKAVLNSNREGESLLAGLWFLRGLAFFFGFFFFLVVFLFLFCLYFFLFHSPLYTSAEKCDNEAPFCHLVSQRGMGELSLVQALFFPGEFKHCLCSSPG